MYKQKKLLAIIPARGGSKGIKNKNIIELCGKPLISYSITEALKSKYIDKVVVSTDSKDIADVSKQYGAEVPFIRPGELATDQAKSIDAIIHGIDELKRRGEEYDYVILLQPTQPLRKAKHIDESIELMIESEEESLVSVRKVIDHPLLIREIDKNGKAVNLIDEVSTQRRQDFKAYYKVNGSIYINLISTLNNDTSLNDNRLCYIMDERYDIDIDEYFDLKIAELKMKVVNSDE